MGTAESNGTGDGDKFDTGLLAPSIEVITSPMWNSDTGRFVINNLLARHRHGDWGTASSSLLALNRRNASDSAIAQGGAVVGIYSLPPGWVAVLGREDLVFITTSVQFPFLNPLKRTVVTFVLFSEELFT